MFKSILARIQQKHRTGSYPGVSPELPDRFCGRPAISPGVCDSACDHCVQSCPAKAVVKHDGRIRIDLGRCIFCRECSRSCPEKKIEFSLEYRLACRDRNDLIIQDGLHTLAESLDQQALRLFGRSLKLRQVSAGGCNACEADSNVLETLFFDLGRFGIQFVASPRHADGLLITGGVTENMKRAVLKTYEAVPAPKIVIAVGACAISGGLFGNNPEIHNGAEGIVPIDLYVPGCPPHPMTILDGLLRLLGKLEATGS